MISELKYSNEALFNRVILYGADKSSKILVVEDFGHEGSYEKIFERLFNVSEINFYIVGVGGKQKVLNLFNHMKGEKNHKNYIYLLDSDFDRILGKIVSDDRVVYLKRYNIENYLIDEHSTIETIRLMRLETKQEIRKYFNYKEWYEYTVNGLKPYYYLYILIQKYGLPIENVGYGIHRIYDSKSKVIKNNYKNEIDNLLSIKYSLDVEEELGIIKKKIEIDFNDDISKLICGKDLIDLFSYYLKSLNTHHSLRELKNVLITNFDVSNLNYLKERVGKLLSN